MIYPDYSKVEILDSLAKEEKEYQILIDALQSVWQKFIKGNRGPWKEKLTIHHVSCERQPQGTNLCGYFVCEWIRMQISERRPSTFVELDRLRRDLPYKDRFQPLQEEIAGFLMADVIHPKGKFNGTGC